jgi:UDP-N-acetyl-D-glucosamine/UDP-N-acetyl-D-galactosamine dehydrogenase
MNETKICVIGLGYVGLPLARLFSTKYKTIGFDMNQARVTALMAGHDATLEVSDELLQSALANGFKCTANIEEIRDYNFYVVAVPTPVDKNNNPDLTPLYGASTTVGKVISKGDIVVYESTVYPGVTEDECIPVVEKVSGLKFNEDFFAGYSPERINPGDKLHTVEKIKKVTSGSTPEIGKKVNEVYASVITAGTHLAPTMKVAEAAKVIENSQRDINIAFVNELSKIFTKMGIDTQDVLEAASTKWNFLPFKPGLVGGHCIGVDPYYLAQCAQRHGYNPEMCTGGNYRSIYLIYFLTYFRRRTGSNLFDFFYCMKFISRIYTFRAIASKEIFIKFQSGHFFHNRDTFVFCNTWINSRFIHHNIPIPWHVLIKQNPF